MIKLKYDGRTLSFPEPNVSSSDEYGSFKVYFCNTDFWEVEQFEEGKDCTIVKNNSRYGYVRGPEEGAYTKEDFLELIKRDWLTSIEVSLDRVQWILQYLEK